MESSSKVTVTYWDPSSVFPLIEPEVRAHLPLRNLHWKAPSRPLRSISTLHVELIPYTGTNNAALIPPPVANDRRPSLTPSIASGAGDYTSGPGVTTGGKRRRHQIPGLRNTPYLKVYILRCDDNETYKSTSRKLLREWVSTHATSSPSGSSSSTLGTGGSSTALTTTTKSAPKESTASANAKKHSQHDASEWLIIHVILPGTQAYSQQRAHSQTPGTTTTNRGWAGMKGSTSLLEKIRSDFNTSSKAGIKDRVIQLRVHPSHPDISTLSPPVPIPPYTLWSSPPEPKEETDAAYQELITKYKQQILSSFDARVAQYEDDIKEKDGQRRLPGWNFCTFFVLKEGLARAFESVGLVEDALVLYDELGVGLESFLRNEDEDGGGALSIGEWTDEAREWVYRAQERLRRKLRIRHEKETMEVSGLIIEDTEAQSPKTVTASETTDSDEATLRPDDDGSESEKSDGEFLDSEQPLSPYKKPYRDLILSNQISIFDFKCYLFSRQLNLLLRLGGGHNAIPTPTIGSHPSTASSQWTVHGSPASTASLTAFGEEDLKCLAEICRRGVEFVTTVGRVLRKDLYKGWRSINSTPNPETVDKYEEEEKERVITNLIDDIVKNWMFSVCTQLLEKTSTRAIPAQVLYGVPSAVGTPSMDTGYFPKRTSSLPSTPSAEITTFMQREREREREQPVTAQKHPNRPISLLLSGPTAGDLPSQGPVPSNPNLEELAAARGDVLLLARSLVEGFARRKGWIEAWGSVGKGGTVTNRWFGQSGLQEEKDKIDEEMTEVDLSNDSTKSKEKEKPPGQEETTEGVEVGCGIGNKALRKAVNSELGFYELFEELSEKARRHFMLGKKVKSGERVVADLAALKFHLQDYRTAAHHLEKLTGFYNDDGWTLIETNLLTMYATCLKMMNKKEDYVRILLKLLTKSAAVKRRWEWKRAGRPGLGFDDFSPSGGEGGFFGLGGGLDAEGLNVKGYAKEIITLSPRLGQNIMTPMSDFWADVTVEPYPRHLGDMDGFEVLVKMRYLLEEEMEVQSIKVRLISMVGGASGREIWMSSGPRVFKTGTERIWLRTNLNIPGSYIVDQILINSYNLIFVHEILQKNTPSTPVALTASNAAAAISAAKKSRLHFWPSPRSLDVKLFLPKKVNLEDVRAVELEITTGWNDMKRGELVIKSATAGLRLVIANVEAISGRPEILSDNVGKKAKAGMIILGDMRRDEKLVLRIPYTAEGELVELGVKIELTFTTPKGEFFFAANPSVPVALPLAVNVQDVFKRDALFSRFLVSTALGIPLKVFNVKLQGSNTFEAVSGVGTVGNMFVVPKQPASFVYKITRKKDVPTMAPGARIPPLALEIEYRSVDEEIFLSVSSLLKHELLASNLEIYSFLLLPVLRSRLETKSLYELERAGFINELQLGTYDEFGWEEALEGVNPRIFSGNKESPREQLVKCLRGFHEKHAMVELYRSWEELPEELRNITRTIVIPVEIPGLDVIHTVELKVIQNEPESDTSTTSPSEGISNGTTNPLVPSSHLHNTIVITGSPLPATLTIHHSRAWNGDHPHPNFLNQDPTLPPLEFFYEVLAPLDTWLIGGRKRGHFTADREGQTFTFPLLLIPIKSGNLLYPVVEVKPAVPASTTSRGDEDTERDEMMVEVGVGLDAGSVSSETDYRNNAESILVLPDVRSTTVRIGNVGVGGEREGGMSRAGSVSAGSVAGLNVATGGWK